MMPWSATLQQERRRTCHDAVGGLVPRVVLPVHLCQPACMARRVHNDAACNLQPVLALDGGRPAAVAAFLHFAHVKLDIAVDALPYELALELQAVHSRVRTAEKPACRFVHVRAWQRVAQNEAARREQAL
jgi:hypothetical protein